ncbi:MAG TPA: hypothetical protein VMV40_03495 [Acidiferrobacter sp.]|nr:hypothetical protein [Acidiferrobacter sp.]
MCQRQVLLIADAYYASAKIILPLLAGGHQLLTRAKGCVVAYLPAPAPVSRGKGRPKLYGNKVRLKDAAKEEQAFIEAPSPVYGENHVQVRYRVMDLIVSAPLTPPSHTSLHADIVWAMEGSIGRTGQPEWQQFFNNQGRYGLTPAPG